MFIIKTIIFLLICDASKRYNASAVDYEMKCECGKKKMDERSEKDCRMSAKLEASSQGREIASVCY